MSRFSVPTFFVHRDAETEIISSPQRDLDTQLR